MHCKDHDDLIHDDDAYDNASDENGVIKKFEERLAEQRKAKRKTALVDFHDMPKPTEAYCAPRRHCLNRKRF
ncbi:hypothetical protein H5410_021119 [Solanum commersonii]|uniref:Uncharacterized protein n=1 Tax=Solanum commersonii TaxID=4109 RepID=A0A9J5ZG83_SOLCO|nr:hypothetical protein H5410_021119 [Solanum commersonii]